MYSDFDSVLIDSADFKLKSERLAHLFRSDSWLKSVGDHMIACGTVFTLAEVSENSFKVTGANFCRERLCPQCQRRKSLRVYGQMIQVVDCLKDYAVIHMVLSRPNVSASVLPSELTFLYNASSSFFREKPLKRAFKGILRCTEVTYNPERDNFHPHLHCLAFVRKSYFTSRDYMPQSALSDLWDSYTGVTGSCCFLRRVSDAEKAVAEVAKYAVKPFNFDLPDEKELDVYRSLYFALKGRRLIQTYGVVREAFRKLKIDIDSDDDAVPAGVNQYICKWNGSFYDVVGVIK